MSVPESAVVRASCRVLDQHGAWHFNIGAQNGETGLPDRIAVHRGITIVIEFKRPCGGRLAPKQAWQLQRARDAGAIALVVTDPEQLRTVLTEIEGRA